MQAVPEVEGADFSFSDESWQLVAGTYMRTTATLSWFLHSSPRFLTETVAMPALLPIVEAMQAIPGRAGRAGYTYDIVLRSVPRGRSAF